MGSRPGTARRPARTSASAARFEARARAARWRARRRVLVVLVAVAAVAGAGWLGWSGPLLRVRSVQVVGLQGDEAARVQALGAPYRAQPLAQVDTGALRRDVGALAYVERAQVERGWPSTLRLRVTRRVPVAAVQRAGGGYALLDASGVGFEVAGQPPRGVPVMALPSAGRARSDALAAALAVLAALPPPVHGSVTRVDATSAADVQVHWRGRVLVWGSATDLPLKGRVLQALLKQLARVYDVSAPHTPVLR